MKLGSERERRRANTLDQSDISTICATLEFFGVESPLIRQTVWDLRVPKYRVFDWLAMGIDRCVNQKQDNDSNNVWVALANVYLNTSSPAQFVEALRFNDLQLYEGKFHSREFADSIKKWNDDDLKWKSSEEYKKTLR